MKRRWLLKRHGCVRCCTNAARKEIVCAKPERDLDHELLDFVVFSDDG